MKSTRSVVAAVVAFVALVAVACVPPPPKPAPKPAAKPAPKPAPKPTTTTTTKPPAPPWIPSISRVDVQVVDPDASPVVVKVSATVPAPPAGGPPLAFRFVALSGGKGIPSPVSSSPTATFELSYPGEWSFMADLITDCPGLKGCTLSKFSSQKVTVAAPTAEQLAPREAAIAADVLARHNLERTRRGLPPLVEDPQLAAESRVWAAKLAEGAATGHDPELGPFGENVYFVSDGLDWRSAGAPPWSQLSGGSGWAAHAGWMSSPGHRENVLWHGYGTAGVGVVCDVSTGSLALVVRFGAAGSTSPAARPDSEVYATPSEMPGSSATCLAD